MKVGIEEVASIIIMLAFIISALTFIIYMIEFDLDYDHARVIILSCMLIGIACFIIRICKDVNDIDK